VALPSLKADVRIVPHGGHDFIAFEVSSSPAVSSPSGAPSPSLLLDHSRLLSMRFQMNEAVLEQVKQEEKGEGKESPAAAGTWAAGADAGASLEGARGDDQPSPSSTSSSPSASSAPLLVTAHIPASWCTVEVVTDGGRVDVERIKEASLAVDSRGGDISVHNMTGPSVWLSSHEGSIKGNITAATAVLSSGKGAIKLGRLMGRDVLIRSVMGPVAAGFLFGDRVTVEASGSAIEIGTLHANEEARVSGRGGQTHVNIGGVDGTVSVHGRLPRALFL
jgi:hypothetical protein